MRGAEHDTAIGDRRPHEAAPLPPFGKQTKTGAIPVQRLQIVTALATKQKEVTAERIGSNHLLGLGRQPVEAVAKIDWMAGEEHLGAR